MQTNQKPRRTNLFLYLFLGLIFGLLLAGIASVVALLSTNTPITWDNLVQLHLSTPLFLLIDVYALIFAVLFGFIGSQRDKTVFARAQLQWFNQRRGAEIQQLTEKMSDKDNQFKELEAVISRGKQQWEATFDAVKDLILLTDEAGVILRCNRATGEAFQSGFSQLIGRQIDELFMVTMEGEQEKIPLEKSEIQFPDLDGWYAVTRNFLKLDDQQGGWVYVFRNISDRKHSMQELQRLNQYYELLVKNSPIAIVTLNLDDRIIDCNPAFEALFGFNKREAVGWNLDSLISPPDLMDETRSLSENVRQGETVHKITQRRHKNGQLVDVEVFGIPVIIGGKQIGALGLYHDVSELFGMERAGVIATQPADEGAWYTESELAAAAEPEEVVIEDALAEEPVEAPEEAAVIEIADELEAEEEVTIAGEEAVEAEALEEAGVSGTAGEEEVPAPVSIEEQETDLEEMTVEEAGVLKETFKKRAIPITEIEGIGPVYAQKLSEVGIESTSDLLDFGKTRKGREELVEKLGISNKLVLKWVNVADLMRVQGIGEEYSELLEKAGVDTVRELRNRKPANLLAALAAVNETHKLVRRLPHLSEVEGWVQSAKELEPVVTY